MIIDEEDFEQAWDATQMEAGISSEKSVVILASLNEVDSVCATKIAMVRACVLLACRGRALIGRWSDATAVSRPRVPQRDDETRARTHAFFAAQSLRRRRRRSRDSPRRDARSPALTPPPPTPLPSPFPTATATNNTRTTHTNTTPSSPYASA